MSDTTYSTNLALTLLGLSPDDVWGGTTNNNLGTLIEQAISGYVTQNFTDANVTLVMSPGTSATARNMYIECTGTNTATRQLIVPPNKKLYYVYNNTAAVSSATASQCSISGTTLTIDGTITGTFSAGQVISGNGIVNGTTILSQLSGTTGGAGTYLVDTSQTTLATSTASYISGTLQTPTGTTLTIGGTVTGTFAIGQTVTGTGVTSGTAITGYLTGAGGVGTYTVTPAQGPSAQALSASITGSSTNTLVISGGVTGSFAVGQIVTAPGFSATITSGSGGAGTYTITPAQTQSTATLASVSGSVLTLAGTIAGTFASQQIVTDSFGILSGGFVINSQAGGTTGGAGTYNITGTQTLPTATTASLSTVGATSTLTLSGTISGTFGVGQVITDSGGLLVANTTILTVVTPGSVYTVTNQTAHASLTNITVSQYPVFVSYFPVIANTPVAINTAPIAITGALPGGGHGIFVTADGSTGVTVNRGSRQVLVYDGTTVASALTGISSSGSTATNILGGAANEILVQTGTNATGFIAAPNTPNQFLSWTGSGFSWSTGGTSVTSFNGRTGVIVPTTGDYTASQVTNAVATTQFTGTNQALSANGYQKLPGGLIMQWGITSSAIAVDSTVTISLSTAPNIVFPTACLNVHAVAINPNAATQSTNDSFAQVVSYTTNQIVLVNNGTNSGSARALSLMWFAVGY